ncbi:MAG: IclR family transcriptional regulator [Ardenticatenaceae bacterium]|nr:IclR family transcriptional regulator [Ardenticatenaceae bacterium]
MNNVYNMDMATVQAVERALAILAKLGDCPQGMGAAELARAVALPRPTVIRLLHTMEQSQAVERVVDNGRYRLGEGILSLATAVSFSRQLVWLARPFLQELAQQTGETVYLSVPDGYQSHYIEQINSQYHIQPIDWVGSRAPLHLVADGKLFLAHWPEADVARYCERPLIPQAPQSITDAAQLRAHLAQVRQQGFACTRDEFEEGLVAFAAPVLNGEERVVTAVTISGPAYRFPEEQDEQFARRVQETAKAIEEQLKR